MRNNVHWAVVALLVLLAAAVRIGFGAANGISHDEIISVLSAQGNVTRFDAESGALAGKWVPAREWASFLTEPAPLSLRQIARDLGRVDTHPPLYFWLLRFWIDGFGIDDIRLMNLPIMVFASVALFFFARRWLPPWGSALAVGIFLVAPAAIRVSALARPYELLGLISILLALITARIIDGRSKWLDTGLFAGLALAGMLTQYLTALVILTGLLLVFVHRKAQLPRLVLCLAASAIVFVLLHPNFYMQAGNSEASLDTAGRIFFAGWTFRHLIGWQDAWPAPYLLDLVLVTALLVAAALCLLRIRRLPLPVVFCVLPVSLTVLAYLALLLPSQGFGERHMCIVTPFLAVCLAMAVYRFAPRTIPLLIAGLCLVVAPAELALTVMRGSFTSRISAAPQIVTNNLAPGIILRYALQAKDDARIFAAPDLIRNHAWAVSLAPSGIIILNPQYENASRFRRMKEKIETEYAVVDRAWGTTMYVRRGRK